MCLLKFKLWSDGHIVAHGRPLHRLFRLLRSTLSLRQEMGQESVFRKISDGEKTLGSQFSSLFRIVTVKNLLVYFLEL